MPVGPPEHVQIWYPKLHIPLGLKFRCLQPPFHLIVSIPSTPTTCSAGRRGLRRPPAASFLPAVGVSVGFAAGLEHARLEVSFCLTQSDLKWAPARGYTQVNISARGKDCYWPPQGRTPCSCGHEFTTGRVRICSVSAHLLLGALCVGCLERGTYFCLLRARDLQTAPI